MAPKRQESSPTIAVRSCWTVSFLRRPSVLNRRSTTLTPDRTVNERMNEPCCQHFRAVWLTKRALGGEDEGLLPVARVQGVVVLVAPDELAARPSDLGDEAFPLVRIRVQLDQIVERGERDRAPDLVRPCSVSADQGKVTHVSAMLGVPGSLVFRLRLRG